MEDRLEQCFLAKEFEEGEKVLQELQELRQGVTQEEQEHLDSLPPFLQRFSSLAVITHGLSKGVELLEKLKKYKEATVLLRQLLTDRHLQRYRGHWFERLSLDLDSHLKSPESALGVVEEALVDPWVRGGRRLLLVQRAVKIGGWGSRGSRRLNEVKQEAEEEMEHCFRSRRAIFECSTPQARPGREPCLQSWRDCSLRRAGIVLLQRRCLQ